MVVFYIPGEQVKKVTDLLAPPGILWPRSLEARRSTAPPLRVSHLHQTLQSFLVALRIKFALLHVTHKGPQDLTPLPTPGPVQACHPSAHAGLQSHCLVLSSFAHAVPSARNALLLLPLLPIILRPQPKWYLLKEAFCGPPSFCGSFFLSPFPFYATHNLWKWSRSSSGGIHQQLGVAEA